VAAECLKRGFSVQFVETHELKNRVTRLDLCVGDFEFTAFALAEIGVAQPAPFDYPESLNYLLHRSITLTTLQEAANQLKTST
jgi:hypothetical protein